MIGETLNSRYKITEKLGGGAMGTVYRAVDEQSGRNVAIKFIAKNLAADPSMLERFKREGEALRQLRHLNIVGFVDAFQSDDSYVIVMEHVPGGSLYDLLRSGPLPIERAVQITLDLCDALIRSHHLKIIHRDIKPENILMAEDGTPKLADFGVARLSEGTRMTRSGMQVGTPYYMSPEAWDGQTLDARTDIWSLGVVLFEMLAGQPPFVGDTPMSVMKKINEAPPPDLRKMRADVPPDLIRIVGRMLTRNKDRRYQTMREVAVDLERCQQSMHKKGRPVSRTKPAKPLIDFAVLSGKFNKALQSLGAFFTKKNRDVQQRRTNRPLIYGILAIAFALFFGGVFLNKGTPLSSDIYYTAINSGEMEIYRYRSGENILAISSVRERENWYPSPDLIGNLYFTSLSDNGNFEVFRKTSGGQIEQLTHSPGSSSSWAPAPDRLGNLYFASDQEDGKTEIYVIYSNRGIKKRVTHTEGGESWAPAPDGLGNVYYVSNQDGSAEVFVIDANGVEQQVTRTGGGFASWSPAPDGLGNVYYVSNQNGNAQIFVIDKKGIENQVTHGNSNNWGPSPDGLGNLYFTSDRSGATEIYMMNSKGVILSVRDIPLNVWLKDRFSDPTTPETIK